MSTNDINTTCTEALRALERAGVIESAWLEGQRAAMSPQPGVTTWFIVTGAAGEWLHHSGDRRTRSARCVLDLSHPVTAASLIVLVREAWGDPIAYVEPTDPIERAAMERGGAKIPPWCVMVWSGSAWGSVGWGDSGAEACVAALVAKAREVAP